MNVNRKNQFVTHHPALPKGYVPFYYTNFYSVKKKKKVQQKRASYEAAYTSGKEACVLCDDQ